MALSSASSALGRSGEGKSRRQRHSPIRHHPAQTPGHRLAPLQINEPGLPGGQINRWNPRRNFLYVRKRTPSRPCCAAKRNAVRLPGRSRSISQAAKFAYVNPAKRTSPLLFPGVYPCAREPSIKAASSAASGSPLRRRPATTLCRSSGDLFWLNLALASIRFSGISKATIARIMAAI